ncbi:hypothetical protein CC2G_006543 [Coprinopsis cinerea AmutBmut pab1-1]|nr:hypothetical protein CC2G_006543 [Coprinopsis cinerea AmutBmut pab1-1]
MTENFKGGATSRKDALILLIGTSRGPPVADIPRRVTCRGGILPSRYHLFSSSFVQIPADFYRVGAKCGVVALRTCVLRWTRQRRLHTFPDNAEKNDFSKLFFSLCRGCCRTLCAPL